jgi:hypothetical protein
MATSPAANPTPITPPRVPIIDPRTGLIDRAWYQFFLSLFRASQAAIDDQDLGPPTQDLSGDFSNLYDQSQLASMMARYDDCCRVLEQRLDTQPSDALISQLDELVKRVQGLECLPPPVQPVAPRYGAFYDTTDQTAALANTAYGMTFNGTSYSFGVTVGSPTSRIYVDRTSIYNIQFSTQIINTAGGAHDIWIWLRKNGTDVPDSATQLRIEGNNTEAVAAWNFLIDLTAGQYFELMWEVSDTSVSLWHDAGTAVHPAIPSIILTVTDNISTY